MEQSLRSSDVIDWQHPDVLAKARALRGINSDLFQVARRCFEWVRDEIQHFDPRGNRADVNAQFVPPLEALAFAIKIPGEADLPGIWPDPLPVVLEALTAHSDATELWKQLPHLDVTI
jgi:hypothetical protein